MNALAALSKDYEKNIEPIHLDVFAALCIVSAIQLASRHPAYTGRVAGIAISKAMEIQKAIIKVTPDLNEILEMGWNPDFDC